MEIQARPDTERTKYF